MMWDEGMNRKVYWGKDLPDIKGGRENGRHSFLSFLLFTLPCLTEWKKKSFNFQPITQMNENWIFKKKCRQKHDYWWWNKKYLLCLKKIYVGWVLRVTWKIKWSRIPETLYQQSVLSSSCGVLAKDALWKENFRCSDLCWGKQNTQKNSNFALFTNVPKQW